MSKRLPHTTAAGIEDAISVILEMMLYLDARLTRLYQILYNLRSGPDGYNPETEAGARPPMPDLDQGRLEELVQYIREIRQWHPPEG